MELFSVSGEFLFLSPFTPPNDQLILPESIRRHTLNNANVVLGTHSEPDNQWEPISSNLNVGEGANAEAPESLSRFVRSTVGEFVESTQETMTSSEPSMLAKLQQLPGLVKDSLDSAEATEAPSTLSTILSTLSPSPSTTVPSTTASSTTEATSTVASILNNLYQTITGQNATEAPVESFDSIVPAALTAIAGDASITTNTSINGTNCGRVNIMGTIVADSAPYLYPFVIEYSLIGAVVIYVIWRQIGRYPK